MSITSVVNDTVTSESVINALKPLPPTISGYSVGGLDDTALDPAGGQTVQINGTGFLAGATITFDGSAVAVVTYVNPNRLTFTSPAKTAGTYTIYAVNPDGGTAIFIPGIIYSVLPTWTTSAGTLGSYYETTSISNTVIATGDAPITYSLFSGSLPAGSTLYANGVITGTAPVDSSSTTYSFTIQATDAQLQDSTRSFSLTINVDAVTWVSPANATTYTSAVDSAIANVTLSATDAAGYSVSYSANALPTGLSLSGANIAGTPTVIADSSTLLTATAATTNRTATRTINWSITVANDVYFEYNTLLIPGASTTFVDDASTNNFAVSIFGDTRPNSFNPYTPGYYSNYFDGTGDYLSFPNNVVFAFGTGSYTIEFWVNGPLNNDKFFLGGRSAIGTMHITTGGYESTAGVLRYVGSSTILSSNVITDNKWHHCAIVRNGSSNITLYVDGVSVGTGTDTTNYTNTTGTWYIASNDLGISNNPTAYISDLRIVKGTAVYTAAFTPPTTPLTAIANTSLLTCQSNRFLDTSTNNFTITVAGNTSISSFDPFVPNSSYSTYGSGYFDGTGDYLRVPVNAAFVYGTGDFTIETWLYFTSLAPAYQVIYDGRANGGSEVSPVLLTNGAAISYYVGSFRINGGTLSVNTWYHVALSRSTGATKLFLNGVQTGSTYTDTNNYVQATDPFIGGAGDGYPVNGYMSNYRVVKGTAVYTTTFTPPTSPLTAISGTSLLTLQNNQSVNNSVFLDNSTNNFLVTRAGNTTQGTFSPYGGNWSNYFNGSSDYLNVANNTALMLGAGNFTIECWFYITGNSASNPSSERSGQLITKFQNTSNYYTLYVLGNSSTTGNALRLEIVVGGSATTVQYTGTIAQNQWQHFAAVRNGSGSNNITLYLNGTSVATGTNTATDSNTGPVYIGYYGYPSYPNYFNGYISNARIVKGTAVYTSNFTPSTSPLTPITNTNLLTCQSNRFVDNSINNFAITLTGSPTVQRFSPFNPSSFTPTSYSGYFDGTGDYISSPSITAAGGDFTLEGWINGNSTQPQIYATAIYFGGVASTSYELWIQFDHSSNPGKIRFSVSTIVIVPSTSQVSNTWYHVAIVRSGSTASCYIDGVNIGSTTYTSPLGGGALSIGQSPGISSTAYAGYVSNVRFVNGTAVYTGNFTPPITPLTAIANTSLLTCQSTTFIDNSTNNFTITAFGNSQPTQQNPFGYTSATTNGYTPSTIGGSAYFTGGSGQYLDALHSSQQWLSNGNFTIECWFYVQQTSENTLVSKQWQGSSNAYASYLLYTNSSRVLQALFNTGGGWDVQLTGTTTIILNQWNHAAVNRTGNTWNLYLNGKLEATTTNSGTLVNATDNLRVGAQGAQTGAGASVLGYVSDLRITKGVGLYPSQFVPPSTPMVAVPNTMFLLNSTSAGIYDAAMMNNMQTVGDAKLSTAVSKFGGSSMSFDGSGDWLTLPITPQTSLGPTFTIEAWIYLANTTGTKAIYSQSVANTGGYGYLIFYVSGTNLGFYVRPYTSGPETGLLAGTLSATTWTHVAVSVNNTACRIFINGTQVGGTTTVAATTFTPIYSTVGADIVQGYPMNGYIDDLRITKGIARYTSNFTAPTTAFPIY